MAALSYIDVTYLLTSPFLLILIFHVDTYDGIMAFLLMSVHLTFFR